MRRVRPPVVLAALVLSLAAPLRGADPVALASLAPTSTGSVAWSASASDVDGDLVALVARVHAFASASDCAAGTGALETVVVAELSEAGGVPSLAAAGTWCAPEGRWCKLVVEASDATSGGDADASGCVVVGPAPDLRVIVRVGDALPGLGLVTSIDDLGVDDLGNTLVRVDTDHADVLSDQAVLRNGVVRVREGQALAAPAGATIRTFDALSLDAALHDAYTLQMNGTAGGVVDDAGIFLGARLLVQQGTATTAPQFSAGNTLYALHPSGANANGHVLYVAVVKDPALPEFSNDSAIVATVDASGQLASEFLVVRAGQVMPGASGKIQTFGIETGWWSFDAFDTFMFTADEEGDPATDHATYVGSTLVAREGWASPVAGRPWLSLAGAEVDLNDLGDWVLHAEIEGDAASDFVIARNGARLVQEGDAAPVPGSAFTRFGISAPVFVGNTRNVLWFGDWDDPDTSRDTGLFLNDQLVVQEGVTTLDGVTVSFLSGVAHGYDMSPSGEWIVFEGELPGGVGAAFAYHVGPWTYLGHALAGTGGRKPALHGRGSVQGGSLVRLELRDARPNASTALVIGVSDLSAPFKGGVLVPHPDIVFLGLPVDATGALTISFPFPTGVPAGVPVWYQYWPSDPAGPAGFSASNAVRSTTP